MSGVGFWELIILLLIGLIVLGPERLPRVANQIGTWLGQARRMTRVMKRQLEEELDFEQDRNIRPAKLSAPPPLPPRKEYDDRYSPAHGADSVGTGVDASVDTDAATTGGESQSEGESDTASDGSGAVAAEPDREPADTKKS